MRSCLTSSTACSHVCFQGAGRSFLLHRRGLRRSSVRTAGDRTRRRRLNRLSCADWVPHDRGSVSGWPSSGVQHRSGDPLITGTRVPHRGPASSNAHLEFFDLLLVGSVRLGGSPLSTQRQNFRSAATIRCWQSESACFASKAPPACTRPSRVGRSSRALDAAHATSPRFLRQSP